MPIADTSTLGLTQTPSPSPAPATSVPTLPWDQTLTVVCIVAAAVLLAGFGLLRAQAVLGARVATSKQTPDASIVRSWIAIILVLTLVLLSAAALGIPDSSLRSTLIGALTASVGSAITHYFSSKSSDQARQDLLDATVGTELVPDLTNRTEAEATTILGKTSFKFEIDPTSPASSPDAQINKQTPPAGTPSRRGSSVTVYFPPPTT